MSPAPQSSKTHDTRQFTISFADASTEWFGGAREGMPIVRWPDGTLCEPLIFFFGYLAEINFEGIGSMEVRAYTMREWFAYLYSLGLSWIDGTDYRLHKWKQLQAENGVSSSQIEIKLARVFRFYQLIPDAMRYLPDGTRTPEFVGKRRRQHGLPSPITSRIVRTKHGDEVEIWYAAKAVKNAPPYLSVIDADQVASVLSELRSPSATDVTPRMPSAESTYIRERNWGMGRTEAGGGLRAAEVAGLSLGNLTSSLLREGLLSGLGRARARSLGSIADLAEDNAAQEVVLGALKHFKEKRKRLYLPVRIKGKGEKERSAGFMIDLVIDLLVVVIWGGRHRMVRKWQHSDPFYVPPDSVFLSYTTKASLTATAASDIMLAAFRRANVAGSGHHLRKHYATVMAQKILQRNLDRFGYFTHAVLNTVLSEVATALGHSQVNTTTQHYTNLAVIHTTGIEDGKSRKKLMKIWESLLEHRDKLDAERIQMCATAIKVFSELPKDSELYSILHYAMSDPAYNPDGLIELGPPTPNVRKIVDNTQTI